MLRFNGLWKTIAFALTILLFAGLGNARDNPGSQGDDGDKKSPTPPGLFITPTALKHAVQQDLNPSFALPYFSQNYPKFVAGEAVKAVVSPDGTGIAAGSQDGTTRLWRATPAAAAAYVCATAGAPITTAEWAQYIPGLPYHPPCGAR